MKLRFLHVFPLLLLLLFPMRGMAAPVSAPVVPGLNVTAVTAPMVSGEVSAFPLLAGLKSAGITAVESYDPAAGKMLRAELDTSGSPVGDDFPLVENTALFVHASGDATLSLGTVTSCSPLNLTAGFNLAGFACFPAPYLASEFLNSVGLGTITSLSRLDLLSGRWQTAAVDDGKVVGEDFPLTAGEGYVVFTAAAVAGWEPPVPHIAEVTPKRISTNELPATVTINGDHFKADSIALLDGVPLTTTFVSPAQLKADIPAFSAAGAPLLTVKNPDATHGGGFYISNAVAFPVDLPPISFIPNLLTVHQEQSGTTVSLAIPFAAPAGGVTANLSCSNTSVLTVPANVVIPEGENSVPVPLTPLPTGNTANDEAVITASGAGFTPGVATITVIPKPTVNLAPTSTLTGLGWEYFVTVSLTEGAPAGGFQVGLVSSPSGIVSFPASVTIPEGATSTKVTVTATGVGTATITASPPGNALVGTGNTVTVKPIQTLNIGPTLGRMVGVMVSKPTSSLPVGASYGPLTSSAVGVSVGPVMTGLSPDRGATGTVDMTIRINGSGLAGATSISFVPPDGITVQDGSLSAATDGSYVDLHIAIADNAPIMPRTVIVSTASGAVKPASPTTNIFRVTYPAPQIGSLLPNYGLTGSTTTLRVNGRNLQQATEIEFIPPDDIGIGNPPSISSDGSLATLDISIAANAATGFRTVRIKTPGGVTPDAPSAANTFEVRSAVPPAGETYAAYNSIVSTEVGVNVETAATSSPPAAYNPVVSLPAGVAVGPIITSISPRSGAIGSSGVVVRVQGVGLAPATGISFNPPAGITVQSFISASDGSYVEASIDIDQSAPLTGRTVVLSGITALPAAPGANLFNVTLPKPEILAIQPIRKMAGSTFTLTIVGRNLSSSSSIDFTGTGISVNNPPSISSDGTTATVTVSIASDAPTDARVVTVTTPGGVTGNVASAANTFTVTSDAGTSYTSLTSPSVGVLVSSYIPTVPPSSAYGPLLSRPVGISVIPASAPTPPAATYGPVACLPVGVAVGPTITGIAPKTIEPGTTSTITIYGAGLDPGIAVQIQPSSGFTIGTTAVAGDGLSATVSITADAGVAVGAKTIIVSTASGMIKPAATASLLLLAGPKPTTNSMQVGVGSPLAVAGSTVTLTINGTRLQGATDVRFLPSDGIEVNNPPSYYTDGQGEHLSVTVIISNSATGGDRVVVISTPYGSTDSAPAAGNTFTVDQPLASSAQKPGDEKPLVARATDTPARAEKTGDLFHALKMTEALVVTRTREESQLLANVDAVDAATSYSRESERATADVAGLRVGTVYLVAADRGPPRV